METNANKRSENDTLDLSQKKNRKRQKVTNQSSTINASDYIKQLVNFHAGINQSDDITYSPKNIYKANINSGILTNSMANVYTDLEQYDAEQEQELSSNADKDKDKDIDKDKDNDKDKDDNNDDVEIRENIELYNNFQPQSGRPIVNTSMTRYSNQQKLRSPLASVDNQNTVPVNKKQLSLATNDDFYTYQSKPIHIANGIDHFSRLSYEMVLAVFQWLPKKTLMRLCLVNKRFNIVARDESLWGRLDLANKCLNPYALGKILERGIVVFRLAQTKITSPLFSDQVAKTLRCQKLQYLDLSMAVINTRALADLLEKCKNLKRLSLETVPIDRNVCGAIGENCNLESLNLAMCTGLTPLGIEKLFSNLKCLQNLNISWTSLTPECIQSFLRNAPKTLLRLNMAGCRKSLLDDHVSSLVLRCPNLIELDISDCVTLSGTVIDHITTLKNLEYLSMSRCYNVAPSSYVTLNESFHLAFLDIFGILSDDAINGLQQRFPNVGINKFIHSSVARPTVGTRRTSIWGLRTRDN